MRNAGLCEAQAGVKIDRRNINNLRYSDDPTLTAESEEELKSLLMKVKEESEKAGLKVDSQKTKIMWRFLKKLEIELPYDPAFPLLGIHTEENRIERDVHPNVLRSTVYNSQDVEAT